VSSKATKQRQKKVVADEEDPLANKSRPTQPCSSCWIVEELETESALLSWILLHPSMGKRRSMKKKKGMSGGSRHGMVVSFYIFCFQALFEHSALPNFFKQEKRAIFPKIRDFVC
jgi:hypothetical protein